MASWQLTIAALTVAVSASDEWSLEHGFSGCPCIDPYPLTGDGTNSSDCTGVLHDGKCYAREYGTRGCRAYDQVYTDACQAAEPPEYCADKWCWVAPWDCTRPNHRSQLFAQVRISNQTLLNELDCHDDCDSSRQLVYSYGTCGYIDSYNYDAGLRDFVDDIASRGKLRISIPGDEPPYITTAGPNETSGFVEGTSRRGGSVVRFMIDVLAKPPPEGLGLEWEEVPISQPSYAFSPGSSFTACCHSVAINSTDLCIGSIWLFEYRQRLAPFTGAIFQASLKVIAKVRSANVLGFSDMMYQPFSPFDGGMWMALFCALAFAGYAQYTLNATGHQDEEEDDDKDVHGETSLTRDQKIQAKYELARRQMFFPTTYDDAIDMSKSMLYAMHAFLSGGDLRHEPKSPQSWLVHLGFAFLILVTISNYTAQVTANNVIQATSGTITSFEEGLERGYKFCGWASFQVPLESAYPKLRGLYVGLENGNDAFQEMDKGNCDAAILDDMSWTMAQSGLFSKAEDDARYSKHETGAERYHCDTKTLLAATVYSVDIALPVRDDLQRLITWAIVRSRSQGAWASEAQNALSNYPNQCSAATSGTKALSFTSGAGVIFLSLSMSMAGLILNMAWRASPRQWKKRREWARIVKARTEAAGQKVATPSKIHLRA